MRMLLDRWRKPRATRALRNDATVCPARDVLSATIDERCVLLDLRAGRYLGLDDVGTRIWHAVERRATRAELIAELAASYDAPAEVLAADVARFIDMLHRRGLVAGA